METSALISIDIFCKQHHLNSDLIISLHEFGLIAMVVENEERFIDANDLAILQKIINFHDDLQINNEGIEVILNLLEKINYHQQEINTLKNRLRLYEQS